METIKWKELCQLSMVMCKVCKQRLQTPVIEVKTLGNICGNCLRNTPLTVTTRNTELEALLSKFSVSCRYAEMGCTFEGPFSKTCEHEKGCVIRITICPFLHQSEYSNDPASVDDIIKHICEEHKENILSIENGRITIPIPVKKDKNIRYFLLIEDMPFLIETKLDPVTSKILFAFYYYKENDNKKVNFKICKKRGSFNFISDNIYAVAEGNIGCTPGDNVLEIERPVLDYVLGCGETININVNIEKVNKKEHWKLLDNFKCDHCAAYDFKIYQCSECRKKSCANCGTTCYHKNGRWLDNHMAYRFCFPQKMITDLQLLNNCDNNSTVDRYNIFNELYTISVYKCSSLIGGCCCWEGSYDTIMEHFQTEHADIINKPLDNLAKNVEKIYIFLEYNSVIIFKYSYSNDHLNFTVQFIGAKAFSELLAWEICICKDHKQLKFSEICETCIQIKSREINVRDYTTDQKLDITFKIKPKETNI